MTTRSSPLPSDRACRAPFAAPFQSQNQKRPSGRRALACVAVSPRELSHEIAITVRRDGARDAVDRRFARRRNGRRGAARGTAAGRFLRCVGERTQMAGVPRQDERQTRNPSTPLG
ncbi:hypothetical protein [Solimonas variicoloris]|uniref:hypothetical protein n=1 Tax=Solimonas variicoloris TaxID=254408 RepID=UPI0012B54A13|nr:hypothetical protein [Solimonas variicoloris]